jgi:hypothetical protein
MENHTPQKAQDGADMEPINDFDQNHFYETPAVDDTFLAEENRSEEELAHQEIDGTASLANRITAEKELEKEEVHPPSEHQSPPTAADGAKLMDVGRAPDA